MVLQNGEKQSRKMFQIARGTYFRKHRINRKPHGPINSHKGYE